MKKSYLETKANITITMHRYVHDKIEKKEVPQWMECIEYTCKKLNMSQKELMSFVIVDYSLAAYVHGEQVHDRLMKSDKEYVKAQKVLEEKIADSV